MSDDRPIAIWTRFLQNKFDSDVYPSADSLLDDVMVVADRLRKVGLYQRTEAIAHDIDAIERALGASYFNGYDHRSVRRAQELLLIQFNRNMDALKAEADHD